MVGLALVGAAAAQPPSGLFIQGGGYGDFFLLRTDDTPPEEVALGDLFARLWRATTGRTVEIGPENVYKYINITLGARDLTTDVFPRAVREEIGREGYYYATYTPSTRFSAIGATRHLLIAGNTTASTRTGIYGFFRTAFDAEWFAPGVEKTRRAGFQMSELKHTERPAFAMREILVRPSKDHTFAAFRAAHGLPEVPVGGGLGRESTLSLVPPETHFDRHPEYFSEIQGARRALKDDWHKPGAAREHADRMGDLCPSAAGLPAVIVAALREIIDTPAKPDESPLITLRRARAGNFAGQQVWSLAPMRGVPPCGCAACRAMVEREGSAAASWLQLANAVAEQLEAAYPGAGHRVLFHADGPYLTPPNTMRPAAGVIVAVSTNACDFATPLSEGKTAANRAVADALPAWGRLGDAVWVFDCLGRFGKGPAHFDNLAVLQQNLQWYTQHHVTGVIFQWAGPKPVDDDFSALRQFLAARLLWNPDLDLPGLQMQFFEAYYKEAADAVRAYLDAARAQGIYVPGAEPSDAQRAALVQAQTALSAAVADVPKELRERVAPLLPAQP